MADPPQVDLPPGFLTIYEDVNSEAKRTMSDAPGLVHLAAVLARRDPERFDAAFGDHASENLLHRMVAGHVTEAGPSPLEFLRNAASAGTGRDELAAALVNRLDPKWIAAGPDAGPSGQSDAAGTPSAAATDVEDAGSPAADSAGLTDAQTDKPLLPRTDRFVELVEPDEGIVGRDALVDRVLSLVGRSVPEPSLIAGPAGSGRTVLLAALATRLATDGYQGPLAGAKVIRVVPERLILADTGLILRQIIEDVAGLESPTVLAVDDLEVVARFGTQNQIDEGVLTVLRSCIGIAEVPLVLLVDDAFVGRLAGFNNELTAEMTLVRMEPPGRATLEQIAERWADRLAEHHRVSIPEPVRRLALSPPGRDETDGHPGLAISRLDGACASAALRADRTVADGDLSLSDDPTVLPPDPAALAEELRTHVLGQDHAVETIANRVALTRAGLDLRPGRPDGVFLFVGPTGVGKTELARATAASLFGDERRLLRLDMSEYAGEWAISQLIGPPPGFVGSTDPESWLTTKIRNEPDTVLLLDEIEKASSRVWNTFLQVFDVGRLTDSHGHVADFSRVVVVMTSNMGAEAFSSPAVGFGNRDAEVADDERVLETVRETMAPELINRLDEVVVFRPLDRSAIRAIAEKELAQVVDQLVERGYRLTYEPSVVDHLADTGYSPAYGARHLQRNIERFFLQPLAANPDRDLHATLAHDAIRWNRLDQERP